VEHDKEDTTLADQTPSEMVRHFDRGYAAGMKFATMLANQLGLDVDLCNPYEVMKAAQKRN